MRSMRIWGWVGVAVVATTAMGWGVAKGKPDPNRRPIRFIGGSVTDPRDNGRPVILVASALGVPAEVFRDAFSYVHPAQDGEPDPEQVSQNKEALLSILGPYGVSNDRLDEVSDYYRYMGQRGETWRRRPASGYATVRRGRIVGITVTDPGAGYSSPPAIAVDGFGIVKTRVELAFTRQLDTNGSVKAVRLIGSQSSAQAAR